MKFLLIEVGSFIPYISSCSSTPGVRISQPADLIRPDSYFKPTRQRYILTLSQNKLELPVFCMGFRFNSVKQETEKGRS